MRSGYAARSRVWLMFALCACGELPHEAQPPANAAAGTTASAGAAGTSAGSAAPQPTLDAGTPGTAATAGTTGAAGSTACAQLPCEALGPQTDAAAPTPEDTSTADAGRSDSRNTPKPEYLVPATGPCPELANGYATFRPDGVERSVLLYMSDAAKTLDGPLIFSWHSTLPGPETSTTWLGSGVIEEIKAQGGIVAAPATVDESSTRPWDQTPLGPSGDNDQRLMDEVVACAIEKVGIDVRRIHAIGMSAGGLKTAQVSLRRSGYLASVVVYSGGFIASDHPPDQDPDNAVAAMILYGGIGDISPVDGIPYLDASTRYLEAIRARGGFGLLCNHGGGHSVPNDSQASAWLFMQDHPFGTRPSPYAAGLPTGFSRYCSLDDP